MPPCRFNGAGIYADICGRIRVASHAVLASRGGYFGNQVRGIEPSPTILSLIPAKLTQKILRGEFVEMRELLPDSWHTEELKDTCCRAPLPRQGGLITDVVLWCEGYATMVAVLSTKYPEKTPHFMDYMRSIVCASRTFEGAAWASYDAAFRRRAANRLSLDWSQSDSALFNEAFAGRGKVLHRCIHCLSETHTSRECFHAPQEEPPPPSSHAPALGTPALRTTHLGLRVTGPCHLWNSVACLTAWQVTSARLGSAGLLTSAPAAT